jgi:hypothetical protein
MKKMLNKWIGAAAVGCVLCMVGLAMTGTAFGAGGQELPCVDQDGTVTAKHMGLMWQKATAGPMNWHDAKTYASGLSLGGHSDWRLPTKDELVGLYNSPCKGIMIVGSDLYWSSSSYKGDSHDICDVWYVNLGNGYVGLYYVNNSLRVRAVRNAQ